MTSPEFYTPRSPSATDTIAYTRRVVEQILRNNPLTNATVSGGLMRWLGNYQYGDGSGQIRHLWIGDIGPNDPNLGGIPQRAFIATRDDSRGGVDAIRLYDSNPSEPGGLKQRLMLISGDTQPLMYEERRRGGVEFPTVSVQLSLYGDDVTKWAAASSGTFAAMSLGGFSVVGHDLEYVFFTSSLSGGPAGEFRVRIDHDSGQLFGPVHVLPAGTESPFQGRIAVGGLRGQVVAVRIEGRVTSGTGKVYCTPSTMHCYTNPTL